MGQDYVKKHKPIQEKIKLDKDGVKLDKRVGIWLVHMPRMMSVARTDEERAKATLRLERDPPKRVPKKLKPLGDSSSGSSSESESEEEIEEEIEEYEEDEGETQVAVYDGPSREELVEAVKSTGLDLMGADDLDNDTPLMDAGLDSLAAVEFQSMLAKQYSGVNLPATLIFDFPSAGAIADMVDTE